MPDDVEQHFAFGAMQNLYEIADALLPNVEGMLTSGSCDDVFAVAAEATLLPQRFVNEILEFLNGLRFALFPTSQHFLCFEYSNDAVGRVHQKTGTREKCGDG